MGLWVGDGLRVAGSDIFQDRPSNYFGIQLGSYSVGNGVRESWLAVFRTPHAAEPRPDTKLLGWEENISGRA